MTEATYRRKALPHLLNDFDRRCAYCLDPDEFRHPSETHVDHFDSSLRRKRERHSYPNLMLACSTCNHCKAGKPTVNKLDATQRMLNCTKEDEFPGHIIEDEDGCWVPLTGSGKYHLLAIDLNERCHVNKRLARREAAKRVVALCQTAIQYRAENPAQTHRELIQTISYLVAQLKNFPPIVTEGGLKGLDEWLVEQGLDPDMMTIIEEATEH